MIVGNFHGRVGNILLQNIGLSIIAKKFDMKVKNFLLQEDFEKLNCSFFSGENIFEDKKFYGDNDIIKLLNYEKIDHGIYFDGYFQMRDFVISYKNDILSHFELKYQDNTDEVFVHVRLGDVSHLNAGMSYYQRALRSINFKSGYITSDNIEHRLIKSLINEFNLKIYQNTPIETINFAKNFDNIVLSKGTFSWWIAMLSKSSNIIYPIGDVPWHGDIFVFEDWRGIQI